MSNLKIFQEGEMGVAVASDRDIIGFVGGGTGRDVGGPES
jgi:hypothetical protein